MCYTLELEQEVNLMTTLDQLYDNFYEPIKQTRLENEISLNHKILIENLSKEHRKVVLRIIDAQMMITGLQSRESFICGFKLAMEILSELKYEDGHSFEYKREENDHLSVSDDKIIDE